MRSSKDSVDDNGNDLVSEFDASTYSGDSVYEVFDNEDNIINEELNVWVNTNKRIWEGRVIKTPYSDFPNDSNDLKLIWFNAEN